MTAIKVTKKFNVALVRIITVAAFKQRLNISERNAIRTTSNIYIIDIYDDLIGRLYVNLDDELVAQALGVVLNYLATIDDVLDDSVKTVVDEQARLGLLLGDGADHEKYNGAL